MISGILGKIARFIAKNTLIIAFISIHIIFAVFLGRLFALAPDEGGYIYTFNTVYTWPINTLAQTGSGWITAPTIFLWIVYLPAKILNIFGIPDYFSLRILSIIITALSLYLLKNILDRAIPIGKFPHKIVFIAFFIPSFFLWISVGLRESFIIAETATFLLAFRTKTMVRCLNYWSGRYKSVHHVGFF